MVPSWKRALSWVISTVIATTEKTEKTKDRRLPDVPRFRGGLAFRGAARAWQLRCLMARALRRGWAVVAADPTGPRRSCFAGLIAARSALYGIRAALPLEAPGLSAFAAEEQPDSLNVAEELTETYRGGGVDGTLHRSRLGEHVLYHRLSAPAVLRYLTSRLSAA